MEQAAKIVYTAADITEAERSLYWDLYKEINNIRPRWHTSDESIASFLNNYETLFAQKMEEEREELAWLSEKHDQEFKSWSEYYDFMERKDREEYEAAQRERAEKAAFLKAFFSRFSIVAAVTLWEEGLI